MPGWHAESVEARCAREVRVRCAREADRPIQSRRARGSQPRYLGDKQGTASKTSSQQTQRRRTMLILYLGDKTSSQQTQRRRTMLILFLGDKTSSQQTQRRGPAGKGFECVGWVEDGLSAQTGNCFSCPCRFMGLAGQGLACVGWVEDAPLRDCRLRGASARPAAAVHGLAQWVMKEAIEAIEAIEAEFGPLPRCTGLRSGWAGGGGNWGRG